MCEKGPLHKLFNKNILELLENGDVSVLEDISDEEENNLDDFPIQELEELMDEHNDN